MSESWKINNNNNSSGNVKKTMLVKEEVNVEIVLIIPENKCTLSYVSVDDDISKKKRENNNTHTHTK